MTIWSSPGAGGGCSSWAGSGHRCRSRPTRWSPATVLAAAVAREKKVKFMTPSPALGGACLAAASDGAARRGRAGWPRRGGRRRAARWRGAPGTRTASRRSTPAAAAPSPSSSTTGQCSHGTASSWMERSASCVPSGTEARPAAAAWRLSSWVLLLPPVLQVNGWNGGGAPLSAGPLSQSNSASSSPDPVLQVEQDGAHAAAGTVPWRGRADGEDRESEVGAVASTNCCLCA
ncbi:hypothetical protein SETIT_5G010600v2 [Setaria italica]|uniref:Uncharacterized protein n=1 Tax=Setaria italica TaxID=4555 RepID=A0A368R034_SETIT|nr:hypothetical protein SETIT_5G010600v2 [Setaria italica]